MNRGAAAALLVVATFAIAGYPGMLQEPRPSVTADAEIATRDPEPGDRQDPRQERKHERRRRDSEEGRKDEPRLLQLGMRGRDVLALQRSLAAQTFDPGPRDRSFGYMTLDAVLAFEKVYGLERDGIVPRREARMIERSAPPNPTPLHAPTYIDVDITRQVLFEVRDGKVTHTLPVSTASGETYRSRSGLAVAHTPRGEFTIYSKTTGWRTSYLGSLYSPSYFYGGYAIHGSTSVPAYPASHGCVRIPMHSADAFYERNPIGTPVYVHD